MNAQAIKQELLTLFQSPLFDNRSFTLVRNEEFSVFRSMGGEDFWASCRKNPEGVVESLVKGDDNRSLLVELDIREKDVSRMLNQINDMLNKLELQETSKLTYDNKGDIELILGNQWENLLNTTSEEFKNQVGELVELLKTPLFNNILFDAYIRESGLIHITRINQTAASFFFKNGAAVPSDEFGADILEEAGLGEEALQQILTQLCAVLIKFPKNQQMHLSVSDTKVTLGRKIAYTNKLIL